MSCLLVYSETNRAFWFDSVPLPERGTLHWERYASRWAAACDPHFL